jgi:23S rRNA (cytosine1962-C5)-methyltransferase
MSAVYLKRGRARPFYFGHPWVFSGSVARVEGAPADGDLVDVLDDRGYLLVGGIVG